MPHTWVERIGQLQTNLRKELEKLGGSSDAVTPFSRFDSLFPREVDKLRRPTAPKESTTLDDIFRGFEEERPLEEEERLPLRGGKPFNPFRDLGASDVVTEQRDVLAPFERDFEPAPPISPFGEVPPISPVSEKVTAPFSPELGRMVEERIEQEKEPSFSDNPTFWLFQRNLLPEFMFSSGGVQQDVKLGQEGKPSGIKGRAELEGRSQAIRQQELANDPNPVIRMANTPTEVGGLTPAQLAGIAAIGMGVWQVGASLIQSATQLRRLPEYRVMVQYAKANNIPRESKVFKDAETALRSAINLKRGGATEAADEIMSQFYAAYAKTAPPFRAEPLGRGLPAIIPRGTQTGAMATGGLPKDVPPKIPIRPEIVGAVPPLVPGEPVVPEVTGELEGLKRANPQLFTRAQKASNVEDFIDSVIKLSKTTRENVSIPVLTDFFNRVKGVTPPAGEGVVAEALPEAPGLVSEGVKPPEAPVEPTVQSAEQLPLEPSAIAEGALPPKQPPTGEVLPPSGVPAEPVITNRGKLWLPEPPRTPESFIDFARQELKGSFKGKVGALDTVEQAHQLVLKARDMGENVIPYVMSYLQQAGDITKIFGIDDAGLVTNVANPQNRSLAINDVLSNPSRYDLTPEQREIAKRQGFVYQEALKLGKSYGVEIKEIGTLEEFWQYIARRVTARRDPITGILDTPPPSIGGGALGAKISSQKERVFDEMMQGVDLGFIFEHPDSVAASHIRGIYRLIGNKQAENMVLPLTRKVTKAEPLQFGERAFAQPALRQRAANAEIVNSIDKIFTPEVGVPALKVIADISSALVGQIAALDISAPFIQGLPVLGHDMAQGLQGKRSTIWLRSYAKMFQTLKNPKAINKFREDNQELYKRALEAGVSTGQSEFVAGVPLVQRALGKIPAVGKTLKAFYRETWGRTGEAYSDFLEIARMNYFEQMEPKWKEEGGNINELGALTNRMLGSVSSSARGIGVNRRYTERILAFAANYLRSSLLLLGDLGKGGMKAKEVASALAALLGVGFAFYYAEEKLRGKEPKIRPWAKRLGGDGAEAFTAEIAGRRIGIGSWMYGMIKMVADVAAIAVDDPESLLVWNNNHPVARYAKSKRGPLLGLMIDLATGRNFFGRKFEDAGDYLMRMVEAVTPILVQPLTEKKDLGIPTTPEGAAVAVGAQTLGLRDFPFTLRSQWADDFKEFEEIPPTGSIELKTALKERSVRQNRNRYRELNPEVDAKLFITGQVSSVKTPAAFREVLRLVEEENVDPNEIKAVKTWQTVNTELTEAGWRDTNITLTDRLIRRLLSPEGTSTGTPEGETSEFEDFIRERKERPQLGRKVPVAR